MNFILKQHSDLLRRLRRWDNSTVTVFEIATFFDQLTLWLKPLEYSSDKPDVLNVISTICDDFSGSHVIQLFDDPILINHPVFISIGQTFIMMLTKSSHLKSVRMKEHEEKAFCSMSYFISQLCSHRNEPIESFYGKISKEVSLITEKPNLRNPLLNTVNRREKPITSKPNLKVARMIPGSTKARAVELENTHIDAIKHKRKFLKPVGSLVEERRTKEVSYSVKSPPRKSLFKKYSELFLNDRVFELMRCSIIDLSENEYPSYHVKYKVTERMVRLCSKLNLIAPLRDSIIHCLCSSLYSNTFGTIDSEQVSFTPKQLFFIYQCPMFVIQHIFPDQNQQELLKLCPSVIATTNFIVKKVLSNVGDESDVQKSIDNGFLTQALSFHLELLYHLSVTSFARKYLLQSNIFDILCELLRIKSFVDDACEKQEFYHGNVRTLAYTLMTLCNLVYEKKKLLPIKVSLLRDISQSLNSANDSAIKFAQNSLSDILNEDLIEEDYEPTRLKQDYFDFIENNVIGVQYKLNTNTYQSYEEEDPVAKPGFVTKSFLEKLINDIEKILQDRYECNASQYKGASRRLRICTKQETQEVESLLVPITKCLQSHIYLDVYKNIEVVDTKASGIMSENRKLAPKHIFFMRECTDFLMQHDHQRQDQEKVSLGQVMINKSRTIFPQCLPKIIKRNARNSSSRNFSYWEEFDSSEYPEIEALNYYMKLLTYFATQKSLRAEFINTEVLNNIINVVRDDFWKTKSKLVSKSRYEFLEHSLTLLFNLASAKEINEIIKQKNILKACFELRGTDIKVIRFVAQILMIRLETTCKKDLTDIHSLAKFFIEYVDKSTRSTTRSYQNIQLTSLLKNLKDIVKNDSFTEQFVEEKNGIKVITNCVSMDNTKGEKRKARDKEPNINPVSLSTLKIVRKIEHLSIEIVWMLSFNGPETMKALKSNDAFIDRILQLSKDPNDKSKQKAEAIIWRLGSEKKVLLDQVQKEKERTRVFDDESQRTADSIPFDVLLSYSNNVNDKIISQKIADRLKKAGYRVCADKQSKNRLSLMQNAASKKRVIVACLSSKFRESKYCMSEIDYASSQSCPIVPIVVEENYIVKGWLNHILDKQNIIHFTRTDFQSALLSLIKRIDEIKKPEN